MPSVTYKYPQIERALKYTTYLCVVLFLIGMLNGILTLSLIGFFIPALIRLFLVVTKLIEVKP